MCECLMIVVLVEYLVLFIKCLMLGVVIYLYLIDVWMFWFVREFFRYLY